MYTIGEHLAISNSKLCIKKSKNIIVVRGKPASIIRQINKEAIKEYGKDSGYESFFIRKIDNYCSLWRIFINRN